MSDYSDRNNDGYGSNDHLRHRSTRDFQTENAFRFNRGREGDQAWRMQDYDDNDYRQDNSQRLTYGEQYGFSAYGRAQYDPDQNRGYEDGRGDSWREDQPFSNREQDYRGGRWNRSSRSYDNGRSNANEGNWGPAPRHFGEHGYDNDRNSGGYSGGGMNGGEGRMNAGNRSMDSGSMSGRMGRGEDRGPSTDMRGGGRFERGVPSGMEQFGGEAGSRGGMQRSGSGSSQGRYENYSGRSNYDNGGFDNGGYDNRRSGGYDRSNVDMSRMSGYGTMAQYGRGPHAGKGPKNYRRTDSRIHEDVCERLTDHPDIDASDIEITVQNGEVTLSGTVPDRQMKRMAEDAIENVAGVKDINNQLKVENSEGADGAGTSRTSANGSGMSNGSSASANGSNISGASASGSSASGSSAAGSSTNSGNGSTNASSNGSTNRSDDKSSGDSKRSKTSVS